MFPGYRNMDPYTQHMHHPWEHIPSPYHYYPNWEPTPIHMKTDSFNHPSACGPCPYNNQVKHDSCCNRSYPTDYCSFRPPYFHYQYPPQMYGPYPSYQNAYPPLFIPPHFDHARCDYDIDKNHCCGCPNHNSHRKEGSNVKIEEQNTSPTIDEGPATTPKGNHGSLIQFPYNYYPMMWHPENSTRDGKTEMKTESLPMLNFKDNLKDLRQGQGESTHQGDNKVLQLPYPIFWLPGNGKPEQPVKDKKEIDATPKVAEDWPSKLKIVPLKLLGNENVVEKPGVLEEETKTQHSEKESKIKTIPVMHLDSSSGEKLSMADRPEDVLKNYVTEEKKYDAEIKKGGKKQPSPQKSSKLPPVCLRVEPLPKKNGSNGKGRSPSLLSLKDKVKPHEGNLGDAAIMNKDSDNTTKDIKVIDVEYQPSGEGGKDTAAAIVYGQDMKGVEEQCGEKDRNVVTTEVGVQVKGDVGGNKEEREDIPISQQRMIEREREKVDTSDNYKKQVQKKYSPEDAALLIQSAFRGFNVRRWKPLDKLQKIAQIRGKLNDVKSQIQNYEGSLELDVKQKVIISETIMNLLLQLDTIQGLLPSLRDIRKSVARELVCLQDKLDQLYGQATNEHEEGTQKKDETSSSTSDASEITLTSEEKDLPSAGSHMKEKILSEQPSQYLNVENEFLQESEGSSMACQHDSAVSDKISDAVLEDAVKEPVGQSHIIPLKVLNDEMVPFGEQCYRIPQHEDENDSQADNLSLAEENASIAEKYVNQDVVALPPESEVLDFVMKQQPDSDQSTKWKEMRALTEQDLNDVECDSKHENPSISLLEEQIRNEEFMAVKPNEADKQSLFEVVALKEKSESKKEANSDEGAAIKPEDVTVIRNDEAPEEKSNVVGDAFVVSEELKATFKHVGEGDRSEEYQLEPDSLAAMYPVQPSDAWKEETLSVKEDSEISEYAKPEAKLCVKSAAIDTPVHNNNSQELVEVSSEIPAAETSTIASTDKVGVHSLEVFRSGEMDNESVLLEASVCETGLKEIASIDSESNSKDSSQETHSCTKHEKSLLGDFVNSEIISEEKKLVEDNEKLRQMLEKLLNAGQEQMGVIAELNERVKNLEKKLSKRKKVKVNQKKLNKFSHVVVGKGKVMSYEKEASSAA
ncbi:hypothetical protein IEQ34_003605 [Dendrobium chrysotoxum]|uniref:BAG domain-containing protein n=1 Tax=Dendrobium chrysotoxum TaxID=161865 RepID=A0AAV7HL65_DENCH|nr:hypothetical protein IEQ34_003605 [Dendrobium chrysotoxum]